MSDVPCSTEATYSQLWEAFEQSRWFTRGCTLQELLEPEYTIFCNAKWEILGRLFIPDTRNEPFPLTGFLLRQEIGMLEEGTEAFRTHYGSNITTIVS